MAGQPGKTPMTDEEMSEYNTLVAVDSRLYSKDATAIEKASFIVETIGASLTDIPKKISLSDAERIKIITRKYVNSCCRAGIIPSKTGLARSLGVTRQGLDKHIRDHPMDESTQFLQIVLEAFSEMLSNSSLQGGNNPIVGIFLLKCLYNFKENASEEPDRCDPLGPEPDPEELWERICNGIVPDLEEQTNE